MQAAVYWRRWPSPAPSLGSTSTSFRWLPFPTWVTIGGVWFRFHGCAASRLKVHESESVYYLYSPDADRIKNSGHSCCQLAYFPCWVYNIVSQWITVDLLWSRRTFIPWHFVISFPTMSKSPFVKFPAPFSESISSLGISLTRDKLIVGYCFVLLLGGTLCLCLKAEDKQRGEFRKGLKNIRKKGRRTRPNLMNTGIQSQQFNWNLSS